MNIVANIIEVLCVIAAILVATALLFIGIDYAAGHSETTDAVVVALDYVPAHNHHGSNGRSSTSWAVPPSWNIVVRFPGGEELRGNIPKPLVAVNDTVIVVYNIGHWTHHKYVDRINELDVEEWEDTQ